MRRVALVVVVAVGLGMFLAGCKKAPGKKIMTPEEVGKTLALTLCEKYAGCQPDPAFNKDQCNQDISSGLMDRLKAKTEVKIEQASLDACAKSIQTAGCEVLTSETPPVGCDFLK